MVCPFIHKCGHLEIPKPVPIQCFLQAKNHPDTPKLGLSSLVHSRTCMLSHTLPLHRRQCGQSDVITPWHQWPVTSLPTAWPSASGEEVRMGGRGGLKTILHTKQWSQKEEHSIFFYNQTGVWGVHQSAATPCGDATPTCLVINVSLL